MRIIRPLEPIATFFDMLFPESVPVVCRAPLLRDALALFKEYWTAADSNEVQIHAHNAEELIGRAAAKWRTDILKADASAAHAVELQTQLAALEIKMANSVTKNPVNSALKASGSANVTAQQLHSFLDI